jgi:hypothetical protein
VLWDIAAGCALESQEVAGTCLLDQASEWSKKITIKRSCLPLASGYRLWNKRNCSSCEVDA